MSAKKDFTIARRRPNAPQPTSDGNESSTSSGDAIPSMKEQAGTSSSNTEEQVNQFITGKEPITTMTFQLPVRLHRRLKTHASSTGQTTKEILIRLIEEYLSPRSQ